MSVQILFGDKGIKEAAHLIKDGKIVAFPTETVYGLGAGVFYFEAIERVFDLKKRPSDNPLIVHIADIADVELLVQNIPEDFFVLAEAFFPGPLTLLLPNKHPRVPNNVTGGHSSIAIRMPQHAMALSLIKEVGMPLVGPSANRSGKPSSTTVEHVLQDFSEGLEAILTSGRDCCIGIESTILSLLHDTPTICRPGKLTAEEIEAVLGKSVIRQPSVQNKIITPGMRYRHYAPEAPLHLVFSEEEVQAYIDCAPNKRRRVVRTPSSSHLYAVLREADQAKVEEIIILCNNAVRNDQGLWDRLVRASSSK